MQLFQKKHSFSQFFAAFSRGRLNFEHFPKKDELIADVFPKLRARKNVVGQMSKRSRLKGTFDKQLVKPAQILFKSEPENLENIY